MRIDLVYAFHNQYDSTFMFEAPAESGFSKMDEIFVEDDDNDVPWTVIDSITIDQDDPVYKFIMTVADQEQLPKVKQMKKCFSMNYPVTA